MSRKMRKSEVGGKKRRWVCHLKDKGGQITGSPFKGEGLGGGEKWDFLYYPDNGLEGIIRNLVQGDL